jgi:tight adherence protein C
VLGALLGALAAAGLIVAVASSPPMRRSSLADRLAPYLRDAAPPSRLLTERRPLTPFPPVERLLGPVLHDAAVKLDRVVGGAGSVRRRLDRLGSGLTLEAFRAEQLICGVAGLLAGLALLGLSAAAGSSTSPIVFLLLAIALAVLGVVGRDRWLTRSVRDRERRMLVELPTVTELLALSVAAGEGPLGALERLGRTSHGELAREIRAALADVRAGTSLVPALERMARRTGLPELSRFVDGLTVAVERGTPLADVLRAQAADVRESGRRALLEAGGRKEIQMMVPVVFLVLPVTVVFALFPGFFALHLSVP